MIVRKKPVEVQAHRFAPLVQSLEKVPLWVRQAFDEGKLVHRGDYIEVHTREGVTRCEQGDWVIRGVEGELYPCAHSVFLRTYEIVREEE